VNHRDNLDDNGEDLLMILMTTAEDLLMTLMIPGEDLLMTCDDDTDNHCDVTVL
jgi:hypothetical protein